MKKFVLATLTLGLFIIQPVKAKTFSSTEVQISSYILAQHENQLKLLEKLVNINSGTENIAGIKQVGNILIPLFTQLGFTTQWIATPPAMHRAGTLVAQHQGHKGKRLLLIGHMDTVFPINSPLQKFIRQGDSATGPGVIDDKGGVVVILYALQALYKVHALDDATITVVLTGDEEDSGKPTSISRKALVEAAQNSDIALDFEWAFTNDTATIARRGISNWLIKTQGKEAHSSEIFQENAGDGAIFELARILHQMRVQLSSEKYLSFNPGLILGGTTTSYDTQQSAGSAFGKTNVIAKTAMAKGDLRFLSTPQKENAEKRITAIVNQHLPTTTASIAFEEGIPAMPPTSQNLQLLQLYSKVSTALGHGAIKPLDPGLRGAGDISYIASLVSANLAGLGPVGTGAHSINETLNVPSLSMQTQRAALLMYDLIQSNTKHWANQ